MPPVRRVLYPRSMTPERTRRIAIADDSPAFVAAAADYIASLPGYGLAGTVQAVSQALTLVENALPDVLLLGLGLSPARGLDMVRRVKAPPGAPSRRRAWASACPRASHAAESGGPFPPEPRR